MLTDDISSEELQEAVGFSANPSVQFEVNYLLKRKKD